MEPLLAASANHLSHPYLILQTNHCSGNGYFLSTDNRTPQDNYVAATYSLSVNFVGKPVTKLPSAVSTDHP